MAKKRTTKKSEPPSAQPGPVEASPQSAERAIEVAAPVALPAAELVAAAVAESSPAPAIAESPAIAEPASTEAVPPSVSAESASPASLSSPVSVSKKKKKKKKRDGDRVSALPETVREGHAGAPSEPPTKVDAAALGAKLEKLEAKLGEKQDAHKAAREGFASDPGVDDISVPPVVDLEEHDHFFAAGENAHQRVSHSGASGSFAALDPRHAQKMTAEAHARRAHLSRYVKAAVGLAAALLALGLVFNHYRAKPTDEPVKAGVVQHTPDIPPPQPTETIAHTADVPPPSTASAVPPPEGSASAAASVAATDTAPVASASAPAASASADVVAPPTKTAAQEKATSKAALESGSYGMADAAGERSVALDAGDGEAWLLLGAAYDSMGNKGQARRCYNACVAKAKRGPIDECRQMLAQ